MTLIQMLVNGIVLPLKSRRIICGKSNYRNNENETFWAKYDRFFFFFFIRLTDTLMIILLFKGRKNVYCARISFFCLIEQELDIFKKVLHVVQTHGSNYGYFFILWKNFLYSSPQFKLMCSLINWKWKKKKTHTDLSHCYNNSLTPKTIFPHL